MSPANDQSSDKDHKGNDNFYLGTSLSCKFLLKDRAEGGERGGGRGRGNPTTGGFPILELSPRNGLESILLTTFKTRDKVGFSSRASYLQYYPK